MHISRIESYIGYKEGKCGDVSVTSFLRFTSLPNPLVVHLANNEISYQNSHSSSCVKDALFSNSKQYEIIPNSYLSAIDHTCLIWNMKSLHEKRTDCKTARSPEVHKHCLKEIHIFSVYISKLLSRMRVGYSS